MNYRSISRAALAVSLTFATAVPTLAAPSVFRAAPAVSSDIVEIQYRRDHRANRSDRRNDRRDRFERRGNDTYYNGHRGSRDRRAGYRQHNGFWFPGAAFIAGAIASGAANQPALRPQGNAHVSWCQDRWRSYRVSDNSYQPFNGPRQRCVSPYN